MEETGRVALTDLSICAFLWEYDGLTETNRKQIKAYAFTFDTTRISDHRPRP